ncbi:MAG: L-2-hydroxyglutarate oxidase [Deltaproteobacteria bacterium]|nr:L-2-hydroxyglutarate oxidase [Deltaproteobacteria bacterium]
MDIKADVLICGCGITGITIAYNLVKRGYGNIVVLEKEDSLGKHASGRNSGVLHAGVYYTPDTLKARFCLDGNKLLKKYCKEKRLPLLETGKVIVARNEYELVTLKELYYRALKNGAKVELIDHEHLSEVEPNARTFEKALYSYDTAVIDPLRILKSLYDDIIASGEVKVFFGTRFKGVKGSSTALTSRGAIRFDKFINTAGSFSDVIAHSFGLARNFKLIPFKGVYRKLKNELAGRINSSIYPVPDIKNPFLGVHFTKNVNNEVYLGPTAIPAFGRENYGLVSGLSAEAFEIAYRDMRLFFSNEKFKTIALVEPRKYLFKYFFEDVKRLVKDISPGDIENSSKVGIRPQLVDWLTKELVMDFLVIKDANSIHVLNAISPAFTSSMAFSEFVINTYIEGNAGDRVSRAV